MRTEGIICSWASYGTGIIQDREGNQYYLFHGEVAEAPKTITAGEVVTFDVMEASPIPHAVNVQRELPRRFGSVSRSGPGSLPGDNSWKWITKF